MTDDVLCWIGSLQGKDAGSPQLTHLNVLAIFTVIVAYTIVENTVLEQNFKTPSFIGKYLLFLVNNCRLHNWPEPGFLFRRTT